jgi:hypothetical protein
MTDLNVPVAKDLPAALQNHNCASVLILYPNDNPIEAQINRNVIHQAGPYYSG